MRWLRDSLRAWVMRCWRGASRPSSARGGGGEGDFEDADSVRWGFRHAVDAGSFGDMHRAGAPAHRGVSGDVSGKQRGSADAVVPCNAGAEGGDAAHAVLNRALRPGRPRASDRRGHLTPDKLCHPCGVWHCLAMAQYGGAVWQSGASQGKHDNTSKGRSPCYFGNLAHPMERTVCKGDRGGLQAFRQRHRRAL